MLSPEVWNFDPPPFSVSTKFCVSEEEIHSVLKYQYFNHHVSVIAPDTMKIPNDFINAILEDSQYYRIDKVPLAEFVKKDFINLFIIKGRLTALSLNEFSEENSFFLTPCGKLILSLTKSTFQELGLEDNCVKPLRNSMKKYILVLDLISITNESQKKFERAQRKFTATSNLFFDAVLVWEPEDLKICPSSIAYYFSKKGYFLKTCDVLCSQKLKYNVVVPLYDQKTDIPDLIEWLGAFSLDCDMSSDDYISSMKCPEKSEVFGQVMHFSFTGLIPYSRLKKIISEINKYIITKTPPAWISLTIQGFQDSILKLKNKCLFPSDGDQHCTLMFKSNQPIFIYNYQDKEKKQHPVIQKIIDEKEHEEEKR